MQYNNRAGLRFWGFFSRCLYELFGFLHFLKIFPIITVILFLIYLYNKMKLMAIEVDIIKDDSAKIVDLFQMFTVIIFCNDVTKPYCSEHGLERCGRSQKHQGYFQHLSRSEERRIFPQRKNWNSRIKPKRWSLQLKNVLHLGVTMAGSRPHTWATVAPTN